MTTVGERGQFSSKSLTGTSEQLLKYDNSQIKLCAFNSWIVYIWKKKNSTQLNNTKSHHILCVTNDSVKKKITYLLAGGD